MREKQMKQPSLRRKDNSLKLWLLKHKSNKWIIKTGKKWKRRELESRKQMS